MIPTVDFVGAVLGFVLPVVKSPLRRWLVVGGGLVVAAAWGLWLADDVEASVAGVLGLVLANFLVAMLVGVGVGFALLQIAREYANRLWEAAVDAPSYRRMWAQRSLERPWHAEHVGNSSDVRFAVQASPVDAQTWQSLAGRVETAGFEALCIGDHPGTTVSPIVALAAAAPVTSSLRLGTAVLNGGVREPFDIANDVASLALLAEGRVFLGLGAGHTPQEWHAIGRVYPSPRDRIRRLAELAPLVQQLLDGEVVDHHGEWFTLQSAHLEVTPAARVPLLIGGNSPGIVRVGARLADIVELGGLGRTLADGHFHEVRWHPYQTDQIIDAFHDAAREPEPTLGALVQLVVVTDDAERAATRFLEDMATRQPADSLPSVDELLHDVPFAFIGTIDEIADQVCNAKRRWGFSRFTVREPAVDAISDVMATMRDRG